MKIHRSVGVRKCSARGPLLIAAAFLAAGGAVADAATVAWGPPTTVAGAGDVSTAGTLVEAANTGGDANSVATTVTVNGVTFAGWAPNGGGAFVSPGGRFRLAAAAGYFQQSPNVFGAPALSPFSTLPPNYQTLLATGNVSQSETNANDYTGALTLTISGLTVGTEYLFQWWTNDSRPFTTGPVIATAGNFVSLDPNSSNAAGGVGQYAVGTFTADALAQDVVFSTTGNGNLENAFQLRAIPEPTALGAIAMATVPLLLTRRLRRR